MRPFIRNRAQLGRLFDITGQRAWGGASWDADENKYVTGWPALQEVTLTLTDTQVKALNTTPIVLIDAPGDDKAIVVISATASIEYDSATYATNLELQIKSENATNPQFINDDVLPATADSIGLFLQEETATLQVVENDDIVVTVDDGDPATGDSPVTIKAQYIIIDV